MIENNIKQVEYQSWYHRRQNAKRWRNSKGMKIEVYNPMNMKNEAYHTNTKTDNPSILVLKKREKEIKR